MKQLLLVTLSSLTLFTNNVHTENITYKKQTERFLKASTVHHLCVIFSLRMLIMINFLKMIAAVGMISAFLNP